VSREAIALADLLIQCPDARWHEDGEPQSACRA
jgi:hypothetical protein